MTTKTYAVLDPHANGPFEEIQSGGTVLSCNTDASDIHRLTRGTVGFSSGVHYFEATYFGEGDLPGLAAFGIVTAAHPLSMYVGEDASGVGFKVGDGDIWSNDTSVATVDATTKLITLGCILDADANTATFLIANTAVATVSITAGQTWYPAITVGSTVAFDLSCFVQFGVDAFRFPQPDGIAWFSQTSGHGQIFLCNRTGYVTTPTDTPANRVYDPRILNSESIKITRNASVWPWSSQNSSASYGDLSIENHDGRYDYLLTADARNARVTYRMVPEYGSYADSFVVGMALIDQFQTDGEGAIKASLQDTLVQLQKQLQPRKFPPFVDPGAANRPFPVLIGAARQVPPILIDEEDRIYQVSDLPFTNVAVIRQQGDRLDPNATPPDYHPGDDMATIQLQVLPPGKLTGDFSSIGQQYDIPGAVDVLAGSGLFTTWPSSGSPPTGWTTGGSGTLTRQTSPQNYVALLVTSDPWAPGTNVGKWLKSANPVLRAGRTYNLTFKLFSATGTIPFFTDGLRFGLRVLSALDNDSTSSISPYNRPLIQPMWRNDDVYTFQYTVPAGADRYLYFDLAAATGSVPTASTGVAAVAFYGIRLEELAQAAPSIPLQGITLTGYEKQLIEQRFGLTSSDWVQADTEAIDSRNGYLYGYWTASPVKQEDAARAPLDSCCATLCTDHLGRFRFRQMIDPSTVDDIDVVLDITDINAMVPVNAEIDRADGLKTSVGARFNYEIMDDSDFVTDTNPVTGIDAATREQFKRQAQFILTTSAPLADFYDFARNNGILYTLLDDPAQAQAEIDRVSGFYSTTPRFYRLTVLLAQVDVQAYAQLIFGHVVRVTYKPVIPGYPDGLVRYGLDAKKLVVVNTSLAPADGTGLIELTLWG